MFAFTYLYLCKNYFSWNRADAWHTCTQVTQEWRTRRHTPHTTVFHGARTRGRTIINSSQVYCQRFLDADIADSMSDSFRNPSGWHWNFCIRYARKSIFFFLLHAAWSSKWSESKKIAHKWMCAVNISSVIRVKKRKRNKKEREEINTNLTRSLALLASCCLQQHLSHLLPRRRFSLVHLKRPPQRSTASLSRACKDDQPNTAHNFRSALLAQLHSSYSTRWWLLWLFVPASVFIFIFEHDFTYDSPIHVVSLHRRHSHPVAMLPLLTFRYTSQPKRGTRACDEESEGEGEG